MNLLNNRPFFKGDNEDFPESQKAEKPRRESDFDFMCRVLTREMRYHRDLEDRLGICRTIDEIRKAQEGFPGGKRDKKNEF